MDKRLCFDRSKFFNTKLYVQVVTLSINDSIKLLENIKQEFKRAISWNKYRSEITTQTKNNNLDYLSDPTFRNIIDCLFFHSKMVMMILLETLLLSITCHWKKSNIVMY